ncbi:MAG: hypothetical protein ACI888_000284 [Flavobacteriales bacterium]|jgi:hypothetical protein
MHRLLLLFFVVICISSCKKDFNEVPVAPVLVKAYLHGNKPVTDVYLERVLTSREFDNQETRPIIDAEVNLRIGDELIVLEANGASPGFYTNEEYTVLPGSFVTLEVNYNEKVITSSCEIPEVLLVTSTFDGVSVIDAGGSNQVLGSVSWESDPEYEYLLDLIVDEENPIPLTFNNAQGKFHDSYARPIKTDNATILADDFSFLGLHKLTIYALSPEYSEYFNYAPSQFSGSLYSAPNNINNGFGVFAGLTGTTIEITVEE